jgi:hypothetical protein
LNILNGATYANCAAPTAPAVALNFELPLKHLSPSIFAAGHLDEERTLHWMVKDRTPQPEPSIRPSLRTAAALDTLIFKEN